MLRSAFQNTLLVLAGITVMTLFILVGAKTQPAIVMVTTPLELELVSGEVICRDYQLHENRDRLKIRHFLGDYRLEYTYPGAWWGLLSKTKIVRPGVVDFKEVDNC